MSGMSGHESHAVTRARERYGIELGESGMRAIGREIAAGRSVLLRRDGTVERHLVRVGAVVLPVVVGTATGTVITVLSPRRPKTRRMRK